MNTRAAATAILIILGLMVVGLIVGVASSAFAQTRTSIAADSVIITGARYKTITIVSPAIDAKICVRVSGQDYCVAPEAIREAARAKARAKASGIEPGKVCVERSAGDWRCGTSIVDAYIGDRIAIGKP
jgi:hypothetical protein